MARSKWRKQAKQKWGRRAAEITGDGQFALLAPCGALTVALYGTPEEAEESRRRMDQQGCGGQCTPRLHHIVDLAEPAQLSLLPQQ